MPTFLTTHKMNPALAERIEASIHGRRGKPRAALSPRVVAVMRFGVVAAVLALASSLVLSRHHDRQDLERERAALLDRVRAQGASLTPDDRGAVARAESWLLRFAGAYEGDLVAEELRSPGALAAALARPTVYVRGPVGAFTSAKAIAETASTSAKDPFLLCLIEPPASRAEKVFLPKVRAAYAGGTAIEDPTSNVRRLHEAEVGLPLLLPPWAARVQAAAAPEELTRLRRELERAPIERAKQAAKAALLLVAMDEPGDRAGATELDGERPHDVRIGLVDVTTAKVVLRLRRHVDPSWISTPRRAEYASGLDGCGLAVDVREAVTATRDGDTVTRRGK